MLDSKEYVKNHDFGYGKEGQEKINKLGLRNIEDLKEYVDDVIVNAFVARYNNNIIEFELNKQKTKVQIEVVS